MRIILNTTSLLTQRAGIGNYTYNLFNNIRKLNNCDLTYFSGIQISDKLNSNLSEKLNYKNSDIISNLTPEIFKKEIKKFIFENNIKKNKYDLYHEPNYIPISTKIPFIITVHDLSPIKFQEYHKKNIVKNFTKYLSTSIEKSAAIIVDSEYIKKEIINFIPECSIKVNVIPLGASEGFYPRTRIESIYTISKYGLFYKNYILTVSTIEPRKNLITIVTAYLNLPENIKKNYPLIIVGKTGWKNKGLIEKIKKSEYIKMLGYVDENELPFLYSSSIVVLYLSIYEGFGLPPLEAMSCGAPTVVSNASSIPEVVGSNGIKIDPLDVDALTEQINKIINDEKYAQSISSYGLIRAKEFSWRKTALQTVEVYREVIRMVK